MNQEAIEFFEALKQDEYAFTARDKEMFDVAIQALEEAEKTGHWIDGKCDKCGNHAPYLAIAASTYFINYTDYCPNCGAKMNEVEQVTERNKHCKHCIHHEEYYVKERIGHARGYQPMGKVLHHWCKAKHTCFDGNDYCKDFVREGEQTDGRI